MKRMQWPMGMKSKEGEILFGIIHTGHHASL